MSVVNHAIHTKKPRREHEFIQRSKGEKIFNICNIILMILLLCFFLYPIMNMISISFSNEYAVLRADVTFYPIGFNNMAYKTIFANQDLWRSILNSTFVAGVGCVLSLIALSVAAYPLAFGDFYGKKFYNLLILFTMWFNGGVVPLFLTIQRLGLYNSLWSLIINGLISAYNVVIVRSYFSSIPTSVVESARIDGANDYHILFKLIIPLAKPVLATVALWIIVGHWNDYLNALLFLSNRKNYTLQLVLKELVLNAETSIQNFASVADSTQTSGATALGQQVRNGVLVVSMIPMVILYPFVQRFFVSGVMLGSVKG
jgi:putative aldouronate transport system permease protein